MEQHIVVFNPGQPNQTDVWIEMDLDLLVKVVETMYPIELKPDLFAINIKAKAPQGWQIVKVAVRAKKDGSWLWAK